MRKVLIYLSKSQVEHVQKLTGKEEFSGVDVVQLIMKITHSGDLEYSEMITIFKNMAEFLKKYKKE